MGLDLPKEVLLGCAKWNSLPWQPEPVINTLEPKFIRDWFTQTVQEATNLKQKCWIEHPASTRFCSLQPVGFLPWYYNAMSLRWLENADMETTLPSASVYDTLHWTWPTPTVLAHKPPNPRLRSRTVFRTVLQVVNCKWKKFNQPEVWYFPNVKLKDSKLSCFKVNQLHQFAMSKWFVHPSDHRLGPCIWIVRKQSYPKPAEARFQIKASEAPSGQLLTFATLAFFDFPVWATFDAPSRHLNLGRRMMEDGGWMWKIM